MTIAVVGVVGLAVFAGCGDELTVDRVADRATIESSEVVMYFPRQVEEESDMSDEITGRLEYTDDCLWIAPENGGERFLIAWPPEFEGGVDEGVAEVLDGDDRIVTKSGDLIRLYGTEIDDFSGTDPLPPACEDGPFWAASEDLDLIAIGDEN